MLYICKCRSQGRRQPRRQSQEDEPNDVGSAEPNLVLGHITCVDLFMIVVRCSHRCVVGIVVVHMMLVLEHQPDRLQIDMPSSRAPSGDEQQSE